MERSGNPKWLAGHPKGRAGNLKGQAGNPKGLEPQDVGSESRVRLGNKDGTLGAGAWEWGSKEPRKGAKEGGHGVCGW